MLRDFDLMRIDIEALFECILSSGIVICSFQNAANLL